jgi:hypothetical protein
MTPEERHEYVPAARCRDCQVLTWEASLAHGARRVDAVHAEGCTAPPSRLDLLERARNLVDVGRLIQPMSDNELKEMEAQVSGQDEAEQD